MHFVWVLRDMFYAERERVAKDRDWAALCNRWQIVLDLPEWASDQRWQQHPCGTFAGASGYIIHPCTQKIGWVPEAIQARVNQFGLHPVDEFYTYTLVQARKVMNTECDCLIQTSNQLIVIECKDKTDFKTEQEQCQSILFTCLQRLLPRAEPLIYVKISSDTNSKPTAHHWSWSTIQSYLS